MLQMFIILCVSLVTSVGIVFIINKFLKRYLSEDLLIVLCTFVGFALFMMFIYIQIYMGNSPLYQKSQRKINLWR